jgi:hypothetical protein
MSGVYKDFIVLFGAILVAGLVTCEVSVLLGWLVVLTPTDTFVRQAAEIIISILICGFFVFFARHAYNIEKELRQGSSS